MNGMPDDFYWPLGLLSYGNEVRNSFPEEAELLGVLTILWTRQEMALRTIYLNLLNARRRDYAGAIWDRQPTHQSRRDLLSLALDTVKLTKRQHGLLSHLIKQTKVLADRRNELIHAEYVVHARTDTLHAKVSSPRSTKPAKHQRAAVSDLRKVVDDLSGLIQASEAALFQLAPRRLRITMKNLEEELERFAERNDRSEGGGEVTS